MSYWAMILAALAVASGAVGVARVRRRGANWKSASVLTFAMTILFAGQSAIAIKHSPTLDLIYEALAVVSLGLVLWALVLRTPAG